RRRALDVADQLRVVLKLTEVGQLQRADAASGRELDAVAFVAIGPGDVEIGSARAAIREVLGDARWGRQMHGGRLRRDVTVANIDDPRILLSEGRRPL